MTTADATLEPSDAPIEAGEARAASTPAATTAQAPAPWLGLSVIALAGVVLWLFAATRFGLWEPWETSWAELGQQLREGGAWFTPHLGGKAVARPPLGIWLIALGQQVGGGAEWGMRLPLGILMTGAAASLFLWLREVVGNARGLAAALAFMTCAQVGLGATTLAGDGAMVASTTLAIAAFGAAMQQPGRGRWGLLGAALGLSALAGGWWGVVLPLGVAVTTGMAQLAAQPVDARPPRERLLVLGGVFVAAVAGTLGWAAWQGFHPKAAQLTLMILPAAGLAMGWLAASKTAAVQGLGGRGAWWVVLAPAALALLLMGLLFTPAEGQEAPGFAGLYALLDHHLVVPDRLPKHVTFDFWVRQIGFGAFPWITLAPVAFAWLLRRDESGEGEEGEDTDARRVLAGWFVVALVLLAALGSATEHYLFPAIGALGVSSALLITDDGFWAKLRERAFLPRLAALVAVLTALVICKDLQRYPIELAGPLLTDGEIKLPEGFTWGPSLKVIRYGLMGLVGVFGFAGVSTAVRWGRRLLRRPAVIEAEGAIRAAPGLVGQVASWLETPSKFGLVFTGAAVVIAAVVSLVWVPKLSDHLSVKPTLDAWEEHAQDGELLTTYQLGGAKASYYLSDFEALGTSAAFLERFKAPQRFFSVIPTTALPGLNYEIRKGTEPRRNLHVIDDRSSRYLLVSNQLREGEEERSTIARAILEGRPKPTYPTVSPDEAGARQYPQFDGKVQLIGYELYHADEVDSLGDPTPEAKARWQERKNKGEPAVFKTGERMVIRYVFKVLKRITGAYKLFLHVDYPGSRINGDHDPILGQLPTTQWLPGDYLVDTQWIEIEPGSSSGEWTMYMGFFQGNNRMKVTPKSAHDGVDRVKLGTIQIEAF